MACEKLQDVFYGCTARPLLIDEPMSRHTQVRKGSLRGFLVFEYNSEQLRVSQNCRNDENVNDD